MAILERLAQGDATVTELARPFAVSLPAISKQLRVLERAGLLTREKQGRVRRCHLEAGPMREAVQWLERYRCYWERRLDSLAGYLDQLTNEENRT
jgi:DNA-binding transcriptional ArsR family regulator